VTTPKRFLCRCEDLTVDECKGAISDGYECFEDLKRFLGVGTGPCQGKSCVQAAMHLIAEHRGIPVETVDVMTFRPPVRPVAFATLAAPDAADATSVPEEPAKGAHAEGP
jgi:bacterioferritin-associated ferredoxin